MKRFLAFTLPLIIIGVVLIAIVSKIWPAPYQVTQTVAAPVDLTPWRYAPAMAAIIVVSTLAVYILLAQ